MKNIKEIAYNRYQMNWMLERGIGLEDFAEEIFANLKEREEYISDCNLESALYEMSFGGEMYVCFEEFLDCEYQDEEFMRNLLSDEEFAEYKGLIYKKDFTMTNVLQSMISIMNSKMSAYQGDVGIDISYLYGNHKKDSKFLWLVRDSGTSICSMSSYEIDDLNSVDAWMRQTKEFTLYLIDLEAELVDEIKPDRESILEQYPNFLSLKYIFDDLLNKLDNMTDSEISVQVFSLITKDNRHMQDIAQEVKRLNDETYHYTAKSEFESMRDGDYDSLLYNNYEIYMKAIISVLNKDAKVVTETRCGYGTIELI